MNRLTTTLLSSIAVLGFASAAQAADLVIYEPMEPAYSAPSGSWDGPYIGIFGGYGTGDLTDEAGGDIEGWLLGVNAGVNFTLTDGIIAGVVGDMAWSDMSQGEFTLPWVGSVRGNLGFDGGVFMPYLTAGLAGGYGEVDGVDENFHFGWTAGAGVAFAATEDLSVDLQYRYTDLSPEEYGGTNAGAEYHQITVGLNWAF